MQGGGSATEVLAERGWFGGRQHLVAEAGGFEVVSGHFGDGAAALGVAAG